MIELDCKNNILIVGDEKDLYSKKLIASGLSWVSPEIEKKLSSIKNLQARIRYRHPVNPCKISLKRGKAYVEFSKPQRAITPGQSVVFYSNEELSGGGVIE